MKEGLHSLRWQWALFRTRLAYRWRSMWELTEWPEIALMLAIVLILFWILVLR